MCTTAIQTQYQLLGKDLPVFIVLTGLVQDVTQDQVIIIETESGQKMSFRPHQVHRFSDAFLPQLEQAKEYIQKNGEDDESWLCLCGNCEPMGYFYPCDTSGDEIEPTKEAGFNYLLGCAACGRIIDSKDLSVLGQNPKPKRFN